MVQHWILFFLFACFVNSTWAQDERFYRQMLSGELPGLGALIQEEPQRRYDVLGPNYRVDLNGDGIEEILQPQKRDGVDWLEIRDSSERKIFEAKLLAMGAESVLYKIRLVSISPKVRALILFLDEGHTAGKKIESTARIFVLSFENNDLSTLKLSRGPHYFHEKEAQREQYFRRDYQVNVQDIDQDGVKEIIVQFNHIQRIMRYRKNGEWERL